MIRKSVPKDLAEEVRRVLWLYAEMKPDGYKEAEIGHPELTEAAKRHLQDLGYMEDKMDFGPRVTAHGYQYWERIHTWGPWYWFKLNWFPAIVAAATIAASVGGIVANVLD